MVTGTGTDAPQAQIAIQQLFREINDRVSQARDGLSAVRTQFLCECASLDCFDLIELTGGGVPALARQSAHFAVRPDAAHLHTEIERVLSKEGVPDRPEVAGTEQAPELTPDGRHAQMHMEREY